MCHAHTLVPGLHAIELQLSVHSPWQVLEDGLEKVHVPYAYGFAIIALTVLVKLATYPLSKKSVSAAAYVVSICILEFGGAW
jgi:membrane protein insertase Oxa1/YidC/SpoIIIJ